MNAMTPATAEIATMRMMEPVDREPDEDEPVAKRPATRAEQPAQDGTPDEREDEQERQEIAEAWRVA